MEDKQKLSQRDKRSLVVHILYAYQAHDNDTSLNAIVESVTQGFDVQTSIDDDLYQAIKSIIECESELDEKLVPLLDNWRIERLGCCTHIILRYAIWELLHTDTPSTIIINEAVELSKCFTEKDAYKFVNGIVDRAARSLRPDNNQDDAPSEDVEPA
jgi:transcription antitermination protein NusB